MPDSSTTSISDALGYNNSAPLAIFDLSDGLDPIVMQKLNSNFRILQDRITSIQQVLLILESYSE